MKKHKQLHILLAGFLLAPVFACVTAQAALAVEEGTVRIKCTDGTIITVPDTYTQEQKNEACKSHGGYTPGTPPGYQSAGKECDAQSSGFGDCAETSFKFGGCSESSTGIKCLIVEIMTFLGVGVGIAVVGGIAAGGVVYATSEGNPSKAQKGVTIITNSIIGLVLYLLLFAITNFLVPGGIFQ